MRCPIIKRPCATLWHVEMSDKSCLAQTPFQAAPWNSCRLITCFLRHFDSSGQNLRSLPASVRLSLFLDAWDASSVEWRRGQELFQQLRMNIESSAPHHKMALCHTWHGRMSDKFRLVYRVDRDPVACFQTKQFGLRWPSPGLCFGSIEFIVWGLRHLIWGMPTGSIIFPPATHESGLLRGSHYKTSLCNTLIRWYVK